MNEINQSMNQPTNQSIDESINHQNTITYEDLVAFAEETGDLSAIRDAGPALEVLDIDGDGVIGLLDFIHFAARLKGIYLRAKAEAELEREQQQCE